MVADLLRARPEEVPAGLDPEEEFRILRDDFILQLKNLYLGFLDEEAIAEHLWDVYHDRYIELRPTDPELFRDTKVVGLCLATLTYNVWRLDTGKIPSDRIYPKPNRVLSVYHVQWAREAFGWWRANVARLPYYLHFPRPCKQPDAVITAFIEALPRENIEALEALKPEEVEDGCPVC